MPTITLDKNVFENLVGKSLPLNELKDRISMLGTDLEKVEGNDIVVEIFPNRPDMLSEQGFARAFSSFIGVKTGLREYKVKTSGTKVIIDKSVEKVRPKTACAIIKNLDLDDEKIREIIQIQEKLHLSFGRNRKKVAIGIYPLEKIKTPIKFIAKKPEEISFQPLEYSKEINGKQILEIHPTGKEYAHLLENKSVFPIFIDNNNKILSMPPIINSHDVGKVTEDTKEVFIECSGFDLEPLQKCLNIIVTTLADMGGEIYSMELEYPNEKIVTPNLTPIEKEIDIDYVNKILGENFSEKDIKLYLEKMGFGYKNKKVLVPAYRADILHQIDFIEDIAIAYGYENFNAEIPTISTIGEESPFEKFRNKLADILVGLKMIEVHSYHLTNKDNQNTKMNFDGELVELSNSLTEEYSVLRSWITPCLLEVFNHNKHHEYPQNIFNIGAIFKEGEYSRLGVALCNEDADFTKIKQVFDYLFNALNLEYKIEESDHPSYIKGRCGRIIVKDKKVAYIGEISPEVLSNWELTMPVSSFELNLSELFTLI